MYPQVKGDMSFHFIEEDYLPETFPATLVMYNDGNSFVRTLVDPGGTVFINETVKGIVQGRTCVSSYVVGCEGKYRSAMLCWIAIEDLANARRGN